MVDALQAATDLVKKIQAKGHIAYFAGGWVRDHLMKHPSDDIDIVTDASIEALQKLFPKIIPVGISFGIIIVVHEGHSFEVATFRVEEAYEDGRRPTIIKPASPQEDAKRRDFTINGMFYDPVNKELYDFVGGRKDLEHKLVRCIGNPKDRFQEDRLRMIRAIRYSARFHFTIEPATLAAIKEYAGLLFPSVAIERVFNEFEKMAKFPNFAMALTKLFELGLLQQIFPRTQLWSLLELQHKSRFIDLLPPNTPVIGKIIELFTENSLEEQLALCDDLKISNQDKKWISFRYHCLHVLSLPPHETEDYEWVQLYSHPDFALCYAIYLTKLPEHTKVAFDDAKEIHEQSLLHYIQLAKQNKGVITSEDLLCRGIKPGPSLGKLLKEGNRLAVNEKIKDKNTILLRILEQAK